jgi:hypothetical protein
VALSNDVEIDRAVAQFKGAGKGKQVTAVQLLSVAVLVGCQQGFRSA